MNQKQIVKGFKCSWKCTSYYFKLDSPKQSGGEKLMYQIQETVAMEQQGLRVGTS